MIHSLSSPLSVSPARTFQEDPPSLADLVYRSSLLSQDAPLRRGDRTKVLGLSLLAYGVLGAAFLLLAARSAVTEVAPKAVTISLLEEEPLLTAPPPPPAGVPERRGPIGNAAQAPQEHQPMVLPTSHLLTEGPLPSSDSPASGSGSGTPGGALGGMVGGLVGGSVGGTVGGVLPPRFDAAYLQNPPPDYPSLSRRLGEEGRALLRVLISPEGLPRDIQLQTSTGYPRLDQAALQTVRRWRFVPAMRGDEALAAWVLVPIRFNLES